MRCSAVLWQGAREGACEGGRESFTAQLKQGSPPKRGLISQEPTAPARRQRRGSSELTGGLFLRCLSVPRRCHPPEEDPAWLQEAGKAAGHPPATPLVTSPWAPAGVSQSWGMSFQHN